MKNSYFCLFHSFTKFLLISCLVAVVVFVVAAAAAEILI